MCLQVEENVRLRREEMQGVHAPLLNRMVALQVSQQSLADVHEVPDIQAVFGERTVGELVQLLERLPEVAVD